jgi:hypothetical protein
MLRKSFVRWVGLSEDLIECLAFLLTVFLLPELVGVKCKAWNILYEDAGIA